MTCAWDSVHETEQGMKSQYWVAGTVISELASRNSLLCGWILLLYCTWRLKSDNYSHSFVQRKISQAAYISGSTDLLLMLLWTAWKHLSAVVLLPWLPCIRIGQLTHLGVSRPNSCNGHGRIDVLHRQSRAELIMTREISNTSKSGSGAVEGELDTWSIGVRKKIATYSEILSDLSRQVQYNNNIHPHSSELWDTSSKITVPATQYCDFIPCSVLCTPSHAHVIPWLNSHARIDGDVSRNR
jgi:hypothetical protein